MRYSTFCMALLAGILPQSIASAQATDTKKKPTEVQASPATPLTPAQSWVTFADYPKAELAAGVSGLSIATLKVGADGSIKSCKITKSSGSEALDIKSCELINLRGSFSPEKNEKGEAIESIFLFDVDWRFDKKPTDPLPKGNPGYWTTSNDYPKSALKERREGTVSYNLSVNVKGKVDNCVVIASSGHADFDEVTCAAVTRRARFFPATDRMGSYVPGSFYSGVRWVIPKEEPISKPSDPIFNQASTRCISMGLKVKSKEYIRCVSRQIELLSK